MSSLASPFCFSFGETLTSSSFGSIFSSAPSTSGVAGFDFTKLLGRVTASSENSRLVLFLKTSLMQLHTFHVSLGDRLVTRGHVRSRLPRQFQLVAVHLGLLLCKLGITTTPLGQSIMDNVTATTRIRPACGRFFSV